MVGEKFAKAQKRASNGLKIRRLEQICDICHNANFKNYKT